MASAFEGVSSDEAKSIREMFLAGATMTEIRGSFYTKNGKRKYNASQIRDMRDEIFDPLIADPEKLKTLANGPILNPNEIVRYRQRPGRRPRTARPRPTQAEMWPA